MESTYSTPRSTRILEDPADLYDTPRSSAPHTPRSSTVLEDYDTPRHSGLPQAAQPVNLLQLYDVPRSNRSSLDSVRTLEAVQEEGRESALDKGRDSLDQGKMSTINQEKMSTMNQERESMADQEREHNRVNGDTMHQERVNGDTVYQAPPHPVSLSQSSSSSSLHSELHFSVKTEAGGRDIYCRPSLRGRPPELPPRNTPRTSLHSPPLSPDYMDVEEPQVTLREAPEKPPRDPPRNCSHCRSALEDTGKTINSNGDLFHARCFVCAQCFRQFKDGVFFEFDQRKYCQHDFQVLFAPCCSKCGEFITGRVIRALGAAWHPDCLTCHHCDRPVAELGFSKVDGRAVCRECAARLKQESGPSMCRRCHSSIEGGSLQWQGDHYHPYHFQCAGCRVELTATAREVKSRPGLAANVVNELYCLRCHDKMNIPICGACRRPIEERVVTALGKHWHVEHFACAKCEKAFLGNRHFEKNGLAFCATHYHQLFGSLCHHCDGVIEGDVFTALNKAWCSDHFACSACDTVLGPKTKFFEVDLKPVCKRCHDRYPRATRLRLKKYHDFETARLQQGAGDRK